MNPLVWISYQDMMSKQLGVTLIKWEKPIKDPRDLVLLKDALFRQWNIDAKEILAWSRFEEDPGA